LKDFIKPLVRPSVVLAGYIVAFLVATGAVYWRQVQTLGDPDMQASAGMYLFSDFLLFIKTFGLAATIPTATALYFLRPFARFWSLFSVACVAAAATGIAGLAILIVVYGLKADMAVWGPFAAAGFLRTLIAPVLAPAFVVSVLFAPTWRFRWKLLAATAAEGAPIVFWILHFGLT
jgi:hypothetical protein